MTTSERDMLGLFFSKEGKFKERLGLCDNRIVRKKTRRSESNQQQSLYGTPI